jgi:hypothetical protein
MKTGKREHIAKRTLLTVRETSESGGSPTIRNVARLAVGYIRVSTDMQAAEGLSLEAQQAAIEGYCALHGLKLVRICKDVMSGGKDQRPGRVWISSCAAEFGRGRGREGDVFV